jgi:hypothetical protein
VRSPDDEKASWRWVPGNEGETDLGKGEETLSKRDDVLHLSHCVDTVLHGLRVLSPRTFKHALDACNVIFRPILVRQADDLGSGYLLKKQFGCKKKTYTHTLAMYPKRIR